MIVLHYYVVVIRVTVSDGAKNAIDALKEQNLVVEAYLEEVNALNIKQRIEPSLAFAI